LLLTVAIFKPTVIALKINIMVAACSTIPIAGSMIVLIIAIIVSSPLRFSTSCEKELGVSDIELIPALFIPVGIKKNFLDMYHSASNNL
jgi:tetrahydromethanopterin S-methyltransferase subunit C